MRLGPNLSSLTASPEALPLWPPLLATRGPGTASARHAHHAMHIVLAGGEPLRFTVRDGGPVEAHGMVTAPDVPHSIRAEGKDVLLVFLDPESAAGASLLGSLGGEVRFVSAADRDRLLDGAEPLAIMTSSFGDAWTRRAVDVFGGTGIGERRVVHPRVKKALAILRANADLDDASLETLARAVDLSASRLMHAFTESLGIPLRPYLQWLKVQRAAAGIVSGLPLARAAHAAGFADAAHMSRTFRRMFGVTPRELRETATRGRPIP